MVECQAFQELDEEIEYQIVGRWKECKLEDFEGQKNAKMMLEACSLWMAYIKKFIIEGEKAQEELMKRDTEEQ